MVHGFVFFLFVRPRLRSAWVAKEVKIGGGDIESDLLDVGLSIQHRQIRLLRTPYIFCF